MGSGWALTAGPWSEQRELLESLLIGKPHHEKEYYTNGYDSPFVTKNRRNEGSRSWRSISPRRKRLKWRLRKSRSWRINRNFTHEMPEVFSSRVKLSIFSRNADST